VSGSSLKRGDPADDQNGRPGKEEKMSVSMFNPSAKEDKDVSPLVYLLDELFQKITFTEQLKYLEKLLQEPFRENYNEQFPILLTLLEEHYDYPVGSVNFRKWLRENYKKMIEEECGTFIMVRAREATRLLLMEKILQGWRPALLSIDAEENFAFVLERYKGVDFDIFRKEADNIENLFKKHLNEGGWGIEEVNRYIFREDVPERIKKLFFFWQINGGGVERIEQLTKLIDEFRFQQKKA
jgi:hypothetical protein